MLRTGRAAERAAEWAAAGRARQLQGFALGLISNDDVGLGAFHNKMGETEMSNLIPTLELCAGCCRPLATLLTALYTFLMHRKGLWWSWFAGVEGVEGLSFALRLPTAVHCVGLLVFFVFSLSEGILLVVLFRRKNLSYLYRSIAKLMRCIKRKSTLIVYKIK